MCMGAQQSDPTPSMLFGRSVSARFIHDAVLHGRRSKELCTLTPRANIAALRTSSVSSSRFIMVALGIALFVIGFAITVAGSSSEGLQSEDSSGLNSLTVSGVAISLVGVVTATVGPFASFLRKRG